MSDDSNPPESTAPEHKPSILKGWAAIITSIAALVAALGAILRPPQEPAAKAAYETVASAVKANSEAIAKNHDDIQALRNYMEGYTKGAVPSAPPSAPPSPVSSSSPFTHIRVGAEPVRPAPPPLGSRPSVWNPPDFSQMKKK